MKPVSPEHPLYGLFSELVKCSLIERRLPADPHVDEYLTQLLVRFIHADEVFAVRSQGGRSSQ